MILVVGATGNLGGGITQMLLVQGKTVRILSRPHSNYQPPVAAGAQAVMGDLKDLASLVPACEGIDTVVTTANSALRGDPDNVENVDLNGNRKHSSISAADVAAFTVAAVDNPKAINQRLVLGGPEPLSLRDAAEVYHRVIGCEPNVRSVTPGEPIPGLPESMIPMLIGLDMFESPIDMTDLAQTYRVQLTPFAAVMRPMAQAASA